MSLIADRYSSAAMKAIWTPQSKVLLERELWIAVMKAQQSLGVAIPSDAIAAYEKVKNTTQLLHLISLRLQATCRLRQHSWAMLLFGNQPPLKCFQPRS